GVFDYIEVFYNSTRKHASNGMLSPVDYEIERRKMNEAGV
ncbi:IS3 family transposase, partial [Roseobacter sp.]